MSSSDLIIQQGKTFRRILRWEAKPIIYKAITAITKSAPVRITAVAHDLVDGWRAAVVSVLGMIQVNAENVPPKASDYHQVTVVDVDTIEFNDVNAAGFSEYKSGGYLQYNTPVDLTGYTARMSIKTKAGGTELLSLTTENGGIEVDNTAKTITLSISAADTASITWLNGVYELEMVSSGGEVSTLVYGRISVIREVTT